MSQHTGLRLTPSNSPFYRPTPPRSPTRSRSDVQSASLRLKKVIGTTTASANGFACLPPARQFAYTAGAAVVVCTVDQELHISQRFFRARPLLVPGATGSGVRDGGPATSPWPGSPTPSDARSRIWREQHGGGGSPLNSSTRDWSDSLASSKTSSATAKDRIKAATSVALSPDGKWVALGETGYKPRVLIFPNRDDSSEVPVSIRGEHTFGVHALAFSPDSRYLASLGTVNDGFIYIWSIDTRSGTAMLVASNKCTVPINAMLWVGRTLLTVGLRFIKVWRVEDETPTVELRNGDGTPTPGGGGTPKPRVSEFGNSILNPKHRVLHGKNALLGELLDANIVAALARGDDQAIVVAGTGEISFLDELSRTPTLNTVARMDFYPSSIRLDGTDRLHVAGQLGCLKTFSIADLDNRRTSTLGKSSRQTSLTLKGSQLERANMTAMATIDDLVVELDSERNIRVVRPDTDSNEYALTSQQIPAHNDAVLGVQIVHLRAVGEAAFLTFSGNGSIQLWTREGCAACPRIMVPVPTSLDMYDMSNELRAVTAFDSDDSTSFVAAGDKYGTLSLVEIPSGRVAARVRAHSAEITEAISLVIFGSKYIATCGRDRMIQLWRWEEGRLDLVQTMDEHAAAVTGLLMIAGSDMLLSCSADRTIVVRDAVSRSTAGKQSSLAFMILRTISLRSAPTCITSMGDGDAILVATVDRCISQYNIKTGHVGFGFKSSDNDGGEAAAMSRIRYAEALNGNPTIVGVSSTDKSVRLYSEYGALLARDWGHTEGITDIALLPGDRNGLAANLITVAADSTVFLWDATKSTPDSGVTSPCPEEAGILPETPTLAKAKSPPLNPPLRKVLSSSELSRFKRERSVDANDDTAPTNDLRSGRATSPQRLLHKKSSRLTAIASAPRLEPVFRPTFASTASPPTNTNDSNGRHRSGAKRSPSPPSPYTGKSKKDGKPRRPSLGFALRSKSNENIRAPAHQDNPNGSTNSKMGGSGFGSLTSSTESACRTLRSYRKRISAAPAANLAEGEAVLRALEQELTLTLKLIGQKTSATSPNKASKTTCHRDNDLAEDENLDMPKEVTEAGAERGDQDQNQDQLDEMMDALPGALKSVMIDE